MSSRRQAEPLPARRPAFAAGPGLAGSGRQLRGLRHRLRPRPPVRESDNLPRSGRGSASFHSTTPWTGVSSPPAPRYLCRNNAFGKRNYQMFHIGFSNGWAGTGEPRGGGKKRNGARLVRGGQDEAAPPLRDSSCGGYTPALRCRRRTSGQSRGLFAWGGGNRGPWSDSRSVRHDVRPSGPSRGCLGKGGFSPAGDLNMQDCRI